MTSFGERALYERARLALTDPEGEADAIAPLSPVRARQTMLDFHDRPPAPALPAAHDRDHDLLERLGADLSRTSGRVRCPAHASHGKTLAWRFGDRRVIFHCFAGCTYDEIRSAA